MSETIVAAAGRSSCRRRSSVPRRCRPPGRSASTSRCCSIASSTRPRRPSATTTRCRTTCAQRAAPAVGPARVRHARAARGPLRADLRDGQRDGRSSRRDGRRRHAAAAIAAARSRRGRERTHPESGRQPRRRRHGQLLEQSELEDLRDAAEQPDRFRRGPDRRERALRVPLRPAGSLRIPVVDDHAGCVERIDPHGVRLRSRGRRADRPRHRPLREGHADRDGARSDRQPGRRRRCLRRERHRSAHRPLDALRR